MSLNCLACQLMGGNISDSENDYHGQESRWKWRRLKVQRICQGNISRYEKMRIGSIKMVVNKVRKSHRRSLSAGVLAFVSSTEPRLVRSCGMRRNWSFVEERLRDEKKEVHRLKFI